MADLIRKTAVGPGAEVLANRGRKFLKYVEGLPDFFGGNEIMNQAFKNAMANRTIKLQDGSVVQMRRGPISRVVATTPGAAAQAVQGDNLYVAIDAWTIEATVVDDGEPVATARTRVGILISKADDLRSWRLVTGTFSGFTALDVDVNELVPIGGGFSEVVPRNTTARNPVKTGVSPYQYTLTEVSNFPPVRTFTEEKWPMNVPLSPPQYGAYKWMNGATELVAANSPLYSATVTETSHGGLYYDHDVVGTLTAEDYYEVVNGAYVAADDHGLLCLKMTCSIPFTAHKNGLTDPTTYGGYYLGLGQADSIPYTSANPAAAYGQGNYGTLVLRINGVEHVIDDALTYDGDVWTAYFYSGGQAGTKFLFSRAAYEDNPSYNWNSLRHLAVGVVGANGLITQKIFSPEGAVARSFGHSDRLVKVLNTSSLGAIYSFGGAQLVRRA